jgi:entericidin A
MNNIKKIMVVSFLITAFSMLSACGTVKGFGQDVTHAGKDIQRAAH